MENGAKGVEGRRLVALRTSIGAGTAVAAAALHGIENPANLLSRLRNHGIVLLHPGEDLPALLPVLAQFAPVLRHLIHLPEDDLTQVPDEGSNGADLAPEVLNAGTDLGKLGRRPVHVIPEDLREPFQRQRVVCIRHGSPPFPPRQGEL